MAASANDVARQFAQEKAHALSEAEALFRKRVNDEAGRVMKTEPRPLGYARFVDGIRSTRDDDIKLT